MEDAFYWIVFSCFCMPVVALVWNQGVGSLVEDTAASRAFRNNYLLVYCFQMREWGGATAVATAAGGQGGICLCVCVQAAHTEAHFTTSRFFQQLHTSSSYQPADLLSSHQQQIFLSLLSCRPCFCPLQSVTGCKAPTYTRSMKSMATHQHRSGSCSLQGLDPPWWLAPLWARWQTDCE